MYKVLVLLIALVCSNCTACFALDKNSEEYLRNKYLATKYINRATELAYDGFYNLAFAKGEEAITYAKATKDKKILGTVYRDYADLYSHINDRKNLTKYAELAYAIDKNAWSGRYLSTVYELNKDYENQIKIINSYINIEYETLVPQAYSDRAEAYYHVGEYNKAIKNFTKTIQLENDSTTKFVYGCRIGDMYMLLGEYEKALENYMEIKDLAEFRDSLEFINSKIARAYLQLGDMQKAAEYIKTAKNYDENGMNYKEAQCELFIYTGQCEKAVSLADEVEKARIDDSKYRQNYKIGEIDTASKVREIIYFEHLNTIYYLQGLAYFKLGNKEKALKYLRKSVRCNGEDSVLAKRLLNKISLEV